MSADLVWEDPPDRDRHPVAEWLDALKNRPGSWALLREGARSAVSAHGFDLRKRYPEFEFTTRSAPDGTARLFGRYVGAKP